MASSLYGDELQGDEYTRFPGAEKLIRVLSYSHDFSITGCRHVTVETSSMY